MRQSHIPVFSSRSWHLQTKRTSCFLIHPFLLRPGRMNLHCTQSPNEDFVFFEGIRFPFPGYDERPAPCLPAARSIRPCLLLLFHSLCKKRMVERPDNLLFPVKTILHRGSHLLFPAPKICRNLLYVLWPMA